MSLFQHQRFIWVCLTVRLFSVCTVSQNVPAEAVHQRHDLLSSELEAFRRAVFRQVLNLLLREEDLQSRAQTLSLQTPNTQKPPQVVC